MDAKATERHGKVKLVGDSEGCGMIRGMIDLEIVDVRYELSPDEAGRYSRGDIFIEDLACKAWLQLRFRTFRGALATRLTPAHPWEVRKAA